MKDKQQLVGEILKHNFPKTFELMDKAMAIAVKNNSNEIFSVVLNEEFKHMKYDEQVVLASKFADYIRKLGYWAVSVSQYSTGDVWFKEENKVYRGMKITIWITEDKEVAKTFFTEKKK